MGLFRKNKGTPLKELERYHGKRVSYVVEREGAEENVIGRTGGISVDSEKLVVVCDGHEVFRCSTDGIVCAELMSHNGADIKGRDMTTGSFVISLCITQTKGDIFANALSLHIILSHCSGNIIIVGKERPTVKKTS